MVYAGTTGGVFQSTNAGGSWTAVNTGLPFLTVRALALDPTGASTIFASLVSGSVWQSSLPTPVELVRFVAE